MLLGDADIEGALGKRLGENIDAGARRHCRGNADDLVVFLGFLDEALTEHVLIGGSVRFCFCLRAGRHVEFDDGVILVGGGFRRRIAFALLGDDMDQDRAGLHVADVLEHGQQVVEVMAVDRADIVETKFFEQRAAADHEAARIFLGAIGTIRKHLWEMLAELLGGFTQRTIGLS